MAAAALLLFILLGPGLIFELNLVEQNNHSNNDVQIYLIYERDAIVYESPSHPLPAIAYSNSAYQTVNAGNVSVFVTHTSNENTRPEWYQNGLLCDL